MSTPRSVTYFAAADETALFGRDACLHSVTVGTLAAAAVVTVYNGTSTSGEVKAIINAAAEKHVTFDGARFPAGLFIKLTGGNATVSVVTS